MEDIKLQKLEKIAVITILVICVLGGAVFGYITSEIKNYSGIDNLKSFQPSIPTRLYDINGELIAELYHEKRELVSFEDLPKSLINSFLSAEDLDFYDHFGIAPISIMRAMVKNIFASVKNMKPTIVQGGSTITQQLAKRLFTSGERTITRKILEATLALQIEKKFSKEEILEMYFNQIYFGHGCHGIATAAKFFYEKDFRHLSVVESSVLSILPSKPSGYSPIKYPRRASIKHRDILNRMVNAGFLTQEKSDKIYQDFWPAYVNKFLMEYPTITALSQSVDKAPYFTDYVRQILISKYGPAMIYNEGLSIYTTLDIKRQDAGRRVLTRGVSSQDRISIRANSFKDSHVGQGIVGSYGTLRMIFPLPAVTVSRDQETKFKKKLVTEMIDAYDMVTLFGDSPGGNKAFDSFRLLTSDMITTTMKVEGAIVAIEPKTGYITTMIGGSHFEVANQYNRAIQALRQPGSAFKPFIYGAGIESKTISTGTYLPDAPILDVDATGNTWEPGNYEGDYRGMVPINQALPASINVISIRLYDMVGADKIVSYASKMTKVPVSRFSVNPTLALGTSELTPFEMANAYAIYANRGRDVIPIAVRYILDRDGNEIANIEAEVGSIMAMKEMNGTAQIVSEAVAWIMTHLLRGVVDRGTANEAVRYKAGFTYEAAGKTGTTSNWSDAWFCGYTDDVAAVVWIGYDKPYLSLGRHQAGAEVAAPLWGKYMREIYKGKPAPRFPLQPQGVVAMGGGYGVKGARSQYYDIDEENKGKMKTVLERYMEKEGLTVEQTERKRNR